MLNVISSSQMAVIHLGMGDLQMLFPRETRVSREVYSVTCPCWTCMANAVTLRGTIFRFNENQSEENQMNVVAHMSILTRFSSFYLLKMIYCLE